MKLNSRKIIALLIAVIIIATFNFAFAYANQIIGQTSETFFDKYGEFIYECEIAAAWGNESLFDCDDFAGMYINKNREVVLLFVAGSKGYENAIMRQAELDFILANSDGSKRQPLVIREAKHSYKELNEVKGFFVENLLGRNNENNFYSMSIDYENNRIEIAMFDFSDSKAIESRTMSLINSIFENFKVSEEIITFVEVDKPISLTTNVNGYSTFNNDFSGAVRHFSNTWGEGFIITGHAAGVNTIVRVGTQRIGVIRAVTFNGSDDSGFVQLDPGVSFVPTYTLREERDIAVPAQGSGVSLRGFRTNPIRGATVLSNNFSYTGNGFTWNNLLRLSGAVFPGDSGGGILGDIIDGGRTRTVIGVIHGTDADSAYAIRMANVRRY